MIRDEGYLYTWYASTRLRKCFFLCPPEGKKDQKWGAFLFFFEFCFFFTEGFGHFLITNFWAKMIFFPELCDQKVPKFCSKKLIKLKIKQKNATVFLSFFPSEGRRGGGGKKKIPPLKNVFCRKDNLFFVGKSCLSYGNPVGKYILIPKGSKLNLLC